ncbi:MAG: hypothetical protein HKM22_03480, partial [Gammaproteobacteria bacterium]|nr:hypothetical protein [Gammaproteobacteria bacterium]
LKAGAVREELATEFKASWSAPESITRDAGQLRGGVINALFAMPRPADDKPGYTGVALPNGDYSVIAFSAVTEFDATAADDAKRQTAKRQLEASAAESLVSALRTDLRQSADVTIYRNNLNETSN